MFQEGTAHLVVIQRRVVAEGADGGQLHQAIVGTAVGLAASLGAGGCGLRRGGRGKK